MSFTGSIAARGGAKEDKAVTQRGEKKGVRGKGMESKHRGVCCEAKGRGPGYEI